MNIEHWHWHCNCTYTYLYFRLSVCQTLNLNWVTTESWVFRPLLICIEICYLQVSGNIFKCLTLIPERGNSRRSCWRMFLRLVVAPLALGQELWPDDERREWRQQITSPWKVHHQQFPDVEEMRFSQFDISQDQQIFGVLVTSLELGVNRSRTKTEISCDKKGQFVNNLFYLKRELRTMDETESWGRG